MNRILEGELQKLVHLQADLEKRVIGQSHAAKVVAEAIQRSRAGLSDPNKPIATLAFLGPTGVGKCYFVVCIGTFLSSNKFYRQNGVV